MLDIVFQSNIYSFWKPHNLQSKIENIFEGDYENDGKIYFVKYSQISLILF